MTDADITTTILRQIRDEIVKSNGQLGTLNARVNTLTDQVAMTNQRLDVLTERADMTNERLTVVETVLRDVASQVVFLGRYVKNKQDAAIADLRKRVVRLEKKLG